MGMLMDIAEQYLLPTALWLVMFSMGVGLTLGDFRKIFTNSRAFFLGAGSMLLLVPAAGVTLALLFAPTPALTMGLILLATCPSGILSNLLTDLARGNVALSVSLSLFLSSVYIFTLPFIAYFALGFIYGQAQALSIPADAAITKIMMVTVIPVSVGMTFRALAPRFAARAGSLIKAISTAVLVIVFGMIVVQQWDTLRQSFGIVLSIVVIMNILNVSLALLVSWIGKLDRADRTALTMEHIVRQEATAIFVAVTLLHRNDMSLPMIVNTFIGMAVGIPLVTWLRARAAAQPTGHY